MRAGNGEQGDGSPASEIRKQENRPLAPGPKEGEGLKIGKSAGIKYIKCALIGIITGLANGLFGSGGGTIAVPAMTLLLDAEDHVAHATAISIILPLTVVSAFFYISNNYVDWMLTLKVMLGGMAGGYIGAKLLNICPSKLLRKVFAVFMILAAVRMIK